MTDNFTLFNYSPYNRRPQIRWPDDARIALVVVPNIEYYEYNPPGNSRYQGWERPAPDILYLSHRDYGNRVGLHRMMSVMERYDVRGTVSLNVALCDHMPEIIEDCCNQGWELFSHGIYNTRYMYGLTEDQEREVIRDSIASIKKHSGQDMAGWLSPSITPTIHTTRYLAEAGVKYTCDFSHDDRPIGIEFSGSRIISMPYSYEINDYFALNSYHYTPEEYLDVIKRQFDQLYKEGEESGTVLSLPLHPYIIGQPHRINILDQALDYITGHSAVWRATGREVADHCLAHFDEYYGGNNGR
ncbi:polysaccharide deacetylase family protein [Sneathiella chungangensis]|uniref:Chitooligosaccharide deacetylase n=1 Tax=Sneathiella chungangensis TaxID=1418234 RepID=A0A845MDR1_9PROT|nr:polysaccharide deacetylase family protein [Sneathiella chungangensis]MZR21194.1 polysaccharide deacetylase family protein [Sneathiella chungangensis]